jgi:hypothetical protein
MKGFKIFIGFVGLIASGSALAGGFAPSQSNYQQFITRYRGDIIDPRLNMVAPAFVYEATRALSDDGMGNLRNPDVATFLWRSIENVVNYYANLPANVNNRDFKTRIWQSLVRSLNELANAQQPIAQPVQVVAQPVQSGAMDGIAELRDLRLRTSQIIQTNPSYFYSAGSLQPSWLRSALYAITARGRTPMTIENKYNMQAEIASAVGELMNQILRNDQRLSASQKDNIIQMVRGQVDQFINAQIASGNPEVIAISQSQGRIEQGVDALRTFRMQTAQIIQANPAYFYANGGIQSSWLQEAINRITVNGQITITMQNQAVIEGELAGAAAELMLQLLRNDQRISPSQKESMIQAVRRQVAQFVNSRTMRSRI